MFENTYAKKCNQNKNVDFESYPESKAPLNVMSETKLIILMAVYDVVACNGRVLRAVKALAEMCDINLIGRASNMQCDYLNCQRHDVRLPRHKWLWPIRVFVFCLAILWQAFRTKPDVIYAHSFLPLFPAWLASRILGVKLIYDAHELIVPMQGRFRSITHRLFYYIERCLINSAVLVIAANATRAEIMRTHYGMRRGPLVILNVPIMEQTRTMSNGSEKDWLGPSNGHCRIIYQGAMSMERDLDLFIKVMRFLDEKYELVMVGDGADLERLKQMARDENVESRVRFLGRVPIQDLPGIAKECSVGIISYSFDNPNQRHCAPNKVYEYAQAGIPVVATGQELLRTLVGESGIGMILPRGETVYQTLDRYAEVIRYVAQHREQYIACIPEFLKKNNWDVEKVRLKESFSKLF